MIITDKLNLRKELINLTEKEFYIEINNYELIIYILGENYFVKKVLLQSESENKINEILKLDIKNKLTSILKDFCKLKSSELLFCKINDDLFLKYKRTKKDENYSYLNLNSFKSNIEQINKYKNKINKTEFINENIYEIKDLTINTIYEFDIIQINNQNINHKDIERLNKIFNEEKELIISNNNGNEVSEDLSEQFIKFTNLDNTIEYYTYLCEKVN